MKTLRTLFVIAIVTFGFTNSSKVMAQAKETTDAKAKVLTVITIAEANYLEFGSFGVSPTESGTVKISTAGSRTVTGGVTESSMGTGVSAAAYHVTGEPSYTYAIQLPNDGDVTLTTGGGGVGKTMAVKSWLAKSTAGTESHTATSTLVGGLDDFTVGATIEVAAGQTAGAYAGTFDVTVNYN